MRQIIFAFLVVLVGVTSANASEPVVTDSRIKTFVYNEYDVYNIYTHYGYQTNIEFARGEEIATVSVGDRIAWQIVPVGNRLFIRPMEEDASTNMTIITSERAYQFDLTSSGPGKLKPSEELAYVVRFYYPEDDERLRIAPPVQMAEMVPPPVAPAASYNYRYTFTGPDTIAPLKVFDNGTETFFRLQPAPEGSDAQIFAVGPDGKEYPLGTRVADNGFVAVNTVAHKFVVRYSQADFVCIYNEGI